MSALTKITLQLGRNEGYPDGDRHEGYIINAPINAEGKLDVEIWRKYSKDCKVIRYSANDDNDAEGQLVYKSGKWSISYSADFEEEGLFHLADHRLWVGDYVTVTEKDGDALVYVISQSG